VIRKRAIAALPTAVSDWALFLDVDGTLLEIAETPEEVEVNNRLTELLKSLLPLLEGAVALISGRRVRNVEKLLSVSGLPVAGLHGLERRRADGRLSEARNGKAVEFLREPLRVFAAGWENALVEDKGVALAFHYRRAPQAETAAHDFLTEQIRQHTDLTLLCGKMVFEVKPKYANKGSAIREFMGETPFRGRVPVFAGDDVTDEDGFDAVNGLGGHSIRVGDQGQTAARYRLPDVVAVLGWLALLEARLREKGTGGG
jgi:trehalose 6-phosphate phosphatase